jgi:hypothetical protein
MRKESKKTDAPKAVSFFDCRTSRASASLPEAGKTPGR